jgi:hypothetical protein
MVAHVMRGRRAAGRIQSVDLEATVVAVVVLAIGMVPVLRYASSTDSILRLLAPLLWSAICLVGWTQISYRGLPEGEHLVVDRPQQLATDGYRSSDTCRSCHPHEYDTWHQTYHRSMTQVASPQAVLGEFDGELVSWKSSQWTPSRVDDEFFVTKAGGDPQRIVMTTGSHHMQVYWFSADGGRDLAQFPFVWLVKDQRWLPRTAVFIRPPRDVQPDEAGRWNRECIQCHSTRGQPGLTGEGDIATQVAEFGIACEACHGPGDEHVEANRNPVVRWEAHMKDDADATIFNPGRAGHQRSSEVCGQCHGLAAWDRFGADSEYDRVGFSYRPGDNLEDTRIFFGESMPEAVREDIAFTKPELAAGALWGDQAIRVSGREMNGVVNSPCYKPGVMADGSERPGFACADCHRLHQATDDERPAGEWTNHLMAPDVRNSDRTCLECHPEIGEDVGGHTRHDTADGGVGCYDCHMARSVYGLLTATRQHQVGSPTVAESVDFGRPNACNMCHLDRTLAWTAKELNEWTGEDIPELTDVQREVPAGAIWLLQGDAGQRALSAWYAGWDEAHAASGDAWIATALAPLLDDPYDAVRVIAGRSMSTLPGFEELDYNPVGDPAYRTAIAAEASAKAAASAPADPPLDPARVPALLVGRDDREMALFE